MEHNLQTLKEKCRKYRIELIFAIFAALLFLIAAVSSSIYANYLDQIWAQEQTMGMIRDKMAEKDRRIEMADEQIEIIKKKISDDNQQIERLEAEIESLK